MVSARNEVPRELGVGRGCSLPPILELKMASLGAFWELILLQLNCQSYTHKPVSLDFGL